jgi:hypothetical protein
MEMQVMHRLAGVFAAVGHHPETIFQAFLPGNKSNHLKNMGHHGAVFRRDSGSGGNVGLGDHKNVGRCLGRDVPEGQNGIVLIDLVGRDLPGDDTAE